MGDNKIERITLNSQYNHVYIWTGHFLKVFKLLFKEKLEHYFKS